MLETRYLKLRLIEVILFQIQRTRKRKKESPCVFLSLFPLLLFQSNEHKEWKWKCDLLFHLSFSSCESSQKVIPFFFLSFFIPFIQSFSSFQVRDSILCFFPNPQISNSTEISSDFDCFLSHLFFNRWKLESDNYQVREEGMSGPSIKQSIEQSTMNRDQKVSRRTLMKVLSL